MSTPQDLITIEIRSVQEWDTYYAAYDETLEELEAAEEQADTFRRRVLEIAHGHRVEESDRQRDEDLNQADLLHEAAREAATQAAQAAGSSAVERARA